MFATMTSTLRDSAQSTLTHAKRALVVDDHPIVIDALVTAIGGMRIFDRVDSANSLSQACKLLEHDAACSLAILDLHLGTVEARVTLLGFRERFPDVPVMVFTGDDSLDSITMAFECGARGYVTKTSPMEVVGGAIRILLSGGNYIPPQAMQLLGFPTQVMEPAVATTPLPTLRLSGRQAQVFALLLEGMPNKVIGSRLDMAEGTVKAHLNSVFRVLGVRTRVEAILRARQLRML